MARKATNRRTGPKALDGSKDALKQAAAILSTLSGLRSPTESSEEMGVSLNRYYQLETRALQGMIQALEKRPRGRHRTPEGEVKRLTEEKARLEHDLLRHQALLRTAQRSFGLEPTHPKKAGVRRRRRARVRGRTVLEHLREKAGSDEGAAGAEAESRA